MKPTKLRGECAAKFVRQVKYGRPKKAAYEANGFVKVGK